MYGSPKARRDSGPGRRCARARKVITTASRGPEARRHVEGDGGHAAAGSAEGEGRHHRGPPEPVGASGGRCRGGTGRSRWRTRPRRWRPTRWQRTQTHSDGPGRTAVRTQAALRRDRADTGSGTAAVKARRSSSRWSIVLLDADARALGARRSRPPSHRARRSRERAIAGCPGTRRADCRRVGRRDELGVPDHTRTPHRLA
jgi:hypothetical protein